MLCFAVHLILLLAWENGITEAPWMVKHNNTYNLFYSASGYASPDYCISVAQAPNVLVRPVNMMSSPD